MAGVLACAVVATTFPAPLRAQTHNPYDQAAEICEGQKEVGPQGGLTGWFNPVLRDLAARDWARNQDALEVLHALAARRTVWLSDTLSTLGPERRCAVAEVLLASTVPALERLLRRTKGLRRLELLSRIDELDLGQDASPQLRAALEDAQPDIVAAREAPRAPLTKQAVVSGMNKIKPKVDRCYRRFHIPGTVMVDVVIERSGLVKATVSGTFAGTPTGACVEAAVRTAAFPPSEGLTTPYPFSLK